MPAAGAAEAPAGAAKRARKELRQQDWQRRRAARAGDTLMVMAAWSVLE
jgi:hypothetical protein